MCNNYTVNNKTEELIKIVLAFICVYCTICWKTYKCRSISANAPFSILIENEGLPFKRNEYVKSFRSDKVYDGYNLDITVGRKWNTLAKRDAINRIRKLRKIGAKELPPPYPNGWYSILESSDLKVGEVKSIFALGEHLVAYRTRERNVYVLDAYCPHMGANLGIGGRVIDDQIECPFHQWRFRGSDGKCVNIPYATGVCQGSKLRTWLIREVNDNIFLWYHVNPAEAPWPLPVIKEIENEEFVFHGRNEFFVNCHIQEIPENGADLAHFKAVHEKSILAGGINSATSRWKGAGSHHWQAEWKPCESPYKHFARVTLKHSIEVTSKLHMFEMDVTGEQIGPAYVQLHMKSATFGRIKVLQTITPVEPLIQKVVHRFYSQRILAPITKLVFLGESVMFERDMIMWNHKAFRKHPQLVKEDSAIKLFRSWYLQFYSENSKTFSEASENLDW
uniref:cholesterol 7-desaturase n=1 Tax=Glossina morsitans morsitans TaxID=37546 RepID=A0A1B0FI60_GLOMM